MSDTTDNVILNLRRSIRTTQLDRGHRLTAIDISLSRVRGDQAGDAETCAHGAARIDAIDERIDMIEPRLELRD